MNNINSRILITVVVYILLTIISFSVGWWIIGLALLAGGGFILYRISGPSVGITQLDFLKKIPGNKSWWTYGLVALSTLYYVLLGFGVLKWEWVQFNVLIMLLIIAFSSVLAGSKDISSSLQGVMRLLTVLSIAGIIALMLATRVAPGLIQSLDYSHSSPPPPTEQSAGQQEQLVTPSPTPTPTPRATHRVIASGEVIVLDRNNAITIPEGRKSLCFSYLGIPGDKMVNQKVKIGEEIFSEMGTVCKDISHLSGKLSIVIFPDDNWSSQQIYDFYAYWRDQPGGQGEFPMIRIGE